VFIQRAINRKINMEIYTAYIKYCTVTFKHDSLNINSEMNAIMTGDLWITKFT